MGRPARWATTTAAGGPPASADGKSIGLGAQSKRSDASSVRLTIPSIHLTHDRSEEASTAPQQEPEREDGEEGRAVKAAISTVRRLLGAGATGRVVAFGDSAQGVAQPVCFTAAEGDDIAKIGSKKTTLDGTSPRQQVLAATGAYM